MKQNSILIKQLEEQTGVKAENINIEDSKLLELFHKDKNGNIIQVEYLHLIQLMQNRF